MWFTRYENQTKDNDSVVPTRLGTTQRHINQSLEATPTFYGNELSLSGLVKLKDEETVIQLPSLDNYTNTIDSFIPLVDIKVTMPKQASKTQVLPLNNDHHKGEYVLL